MNAKTFLVGGFAISCGVLAAVLAARWYSTPPANETVLVAQRPLSRWEPIQDYRNLFVAREVPRGEMPRNAVTSHEQLKELARDHVVVKPLNAGEPLSLNHLVNKAEAGLAPTLHDGHVAFAVRTTAESSAGGFIHPNSHVKVYGFRKGANDERRMDLLMKNIRVVAVDTLADKPNNKVAHVASTITLEVTDAEAKALRLAQENGPISLGLIALADLQGKDLYAADNRKGEAEPENPKVKVLVARDAITKGSPLTEYLTMFEFRTLPSEQVPPGALTSYDLLAENASAKILARALRPGEPLAASYLASRDNKVRPTIEIIEPNRYQIGTWDEELGRYTEIHSSPRR